MPRILYNYSWWGLRNNGLMLTPYFKSENSSKVWQVEREGPKSFTQPSTWQANKLLIKTSIKEGSNPQFHPSLRNITDSSNGMSLDIYHNVCAKRETIRFRARGGSQSQPLRTQTTSWQQKLCTSTTFFSPGQTTLGYFHYPLYTKYFFEFVIFYFFTYIYIAPLICTLIKIYAY